MAARRFSPTFPTLLLLSHLLVACTGKAAELPPPIVVDIAPLQSAPETLSAISDEAAALQLVESMDDGTLSAQVIIAGIDGNAVLNAGMKKLLMEHPPGALMLFSYNLKAEKDAVRDFLSECVAAVAAVSCVPFVAVDHEGGEVHRFGSGVTRLPSPASFWDRRQALEKGRVLEEIERRAFQSAVEIRGMGVTMNFAPVAETLSAANAAFLGRRSYGPDAGFTADAAAAFIRGMDAGGVACVVKHFPGNAGADPHTARSVLAADRRELDRLVAPFAALIHTVRPPALMVSHLVVPAFDPDVNASLSPQVIQNWLRGELGFGGIAVADDFSMGAVASSGISAEGAAIAALNAGIDMVMIWPMNLASTHRAILSALKSGVLTRGRLEEAATRILTEKIRYGIVPIRPLPVGLGGPSSGGEGAAPPLN
jgi:beta-N-acetylhexosaminidase